jgi:hypothetical protein
LIQNNNFIPVFQKKLENNHSCSFLLVPEVMTTTAKTAMKPNKELKLRTAAKAVIRGPLKALPNMPRGVETTTKKSVFPGRGVETTTKKPGFLGEAI